LSPTNDQAIEVLKRGVALWPEQPEKRENLAVALARNGQIAEALPHFEALIRLDPQSANGYFNLGSALLQLHRYAESVEAFRAYLKKWPHSPQALASMGTAFIGMGRYSDAESALQRALMRDPRMPEAFSNLGTVQSLRGRYADAEESFRKGLVLAPNHLSIKVKLGWVLIHVPLELSRDWLPLWSAKVSWTLPASCWNLGLMGGTNCPFSLKHMHWSVCALKSLKWHW
jgi:tetratricopeptide (TPR) repeat protein